MPTPKSNWTEGEFFTPAAANDVGQAIVDLQTGGAAATAAVTHAAASKATPVDGDKLPLVDSAASFGLKHLTWANLKVAVATYYNSLTATLTNKTLTSPVISGNILDTNGAIVLQPLPQAGANTYARLTNGVTPGGGVTLDVHTTASSTATFSVNARGNGGVALGNTAGVTAFTALTATGGVNYMRATAAAAGASPNFSAIGADTDIDLELYSKGAGVVRSNGIQVATTSDIELARANDNLTGGGLVSVSATFEVLWGSRMLVLSNGRSALRAASGFWEIHCPAAGTAITGVGGAASTTATAAGIPLAIFDALYYILPIGSNNASVPANFRLVNYTANSVVPSNWVLIALRSDVGSVFFNRFALAAGQSLDAGKIQSDLTVGNTLVRRDATGSFSAGTISANALTVASVPVVTTTGTQSLSNKTIVSPTITGTVTGTSVPHAVPSGLGKVVASPINTEVTSANFAWVPGLTNDLAYAYERGATITVEKNGVALTPGGVAATGVTDYNQFSVFNQDATPQTSGYGGRLAINSLALNDVVVITVGGLVSPVGLSTASAVALGVSFSGSAPGDVKIEAFFNGGWATAYDSVNSPADAQIHLKTAYTGHGAFPIEQLRYTFTRNTVGGFRMNPLFFAANSGPKHAGPLFPRGGGSLYGTTALPPRIDATGNDANIDLMLSAKGTGVVKADNVEVVVVSGAQSLSNKTIASPKITGNIADTNSNIIFGISPQPSAVNYLNFTNSSVGIPPSITGTGADTDISVNIYGKGVGAVSLRNSNGALFTAVGVASAVNNLQAAASATGQDVSVSAQGSDANISLDLRSKGSGVVEANGNTVVNKTAAVPATATSTGIVGQVAYDSTWFYVCTATNTWRRAALSTW